MDIRCPSRKPDPAPSQSAKADFAPLLPRIHSPGDGTRRPIGTCHPPGISGRFGGLSREEARVKAFAELYAALDETTKTGEKVDALARYFAAVPPEELDVKVSHRGSG